jgi:hypothetical protein
MLAVLETQEELLEDLTEVALEQLIMEAVVELTLE